MLEQVLLSTPPLPPNSAAAAYGLLQKKSRMFSLGGNNAFLEFFLEGVPEVMETHLDSKKVTAAIIHVPLLMMTL